MIKDIINDTIHRMDQAVVHTRTEMSKVRTGRANTELVESIKISYYGTLTPLNQLSTISIPEPRLITIHPFDKSVIDEIEKAIMESNANPLVLKNLMKSPIDNAMPVAPKLNKAVPSV